MDVELLECSLDKASGFVAEEEMLCSWAQWPARSCKAPYIVVGRSTIGSRAGAIRLGRRGARHGRAVCGRSWHCGERKRNEDSRWKEESMSSRDQPDFEVSYILMQVLDQLTTSGFLRRLSCVYGLDNEECG